MVQDTDKSESRARATQAVVVDEPVAAAGVAATIAATGVAVAAGRVVVIVQVVDIVVGVELLASGQSQGNKSCDLLRVGSNDFEKKKIRSHSSPPSTNHMICG